MDTFTYTSMDISFRSIMYTQSYTCSRLNNFFFCMSYLLMRVFNQYSFPFVAIVFFVRVCEFVKEKQFPFQIEFLSPLSLPKVFFISYTLPLFFQNKQKQIFYTTTVYGHFHVILSAIFGASKYKKLCNYMSK